MASKEVEVVDATPMDVVLYDHRLFGELKWQDPQDMGRKLGERMNRAKSLDDLFGVLEGSSTKNMIGRKVEILEVDFYAYQADEGVIPNGICQAVDIDTGEVLEFATTSGFCTAFLKKAQLLELFPVKVKITETLTRSGQKAINFEKV
jgi:hypothetical protein